MVHELMSAPLLDSALGGTSGEEPPEERELCALAETGQVSKGAGDLEESSPFRPGKEVRLIKLLSGWKVSSVARPYKNGHDIATDRATCVEQRNGSSGRR